MLFVFESPDSKSALLDIADEVDDMPIITSNSETIAEHVILGDTGTLPPSQSLNKRPFSSMHQRTE